jgi:hypothetical protein
MMSDEEEYKERAETKKGIGLAILNCQSGRNLSVKV